MKITEVRERSSPLIQQLSETWETSVGATYLFLSSDGIEIIKTHVPQTLAEIPHLVTAENDSESPVTFMGIDGQRLEMLFVSGEERGNGLGEQLIQYGIETYSINELVVNRQNPPVRGFYGRMGFHAYHRTEFDEQGNLYPLLHMGCDKR